MENQIAIRVDSRLIHGQILTKWIPARKIEKILLVHNTFAGDSLMSSLYLMNLPADVSGEVVTAAQAAAILSGDSCRGQAVLAVLPDLPTALELFESGFTYQQLQLGNLSGGSGKTVLCDGISVDERDSEILHQLLGQGVDVYCQAVPDQEKLQVTALL